MVTIIKGKFKGKILKFRIMASYFVLIAICLILINALASRELQNYYVNGRKEVITEYAKELADEASVPGVFESEAFKKRMDEIRYESLSSRVYRINYDDFSRKEGRIRYDSYGIGLAFDGQEYVDIVKEGDVNYLYVAIPVVVNTSTVGVIFMANSLADIYSTIDEIKRQLLIISVVTLLVFILASYAVSGRITKPMEKVIGAIEAMAEGKLEQKVEAKGKDELARLCHAFNNMNEKINDMDKERRQFVADASHELKSPLASIKVLVQSLEEGGVENKEIAYDFLKDIDSEVDRLTNIVGRLLELTRLEAGYGMKIERFEIGKMIKEVAAKIVPIANRRNIKINCCTKDEFIDGNRDNIFRAIYNIVENAVKYSDDGGTVDVWMETGNEVKIFIKDRGPGIPEEDLYKIFDRFYRVDKARNRKTGGSGLGLSIVKEIIKRHNGRVEVQSRVGEGSLFMIAIPYRLKIKEC